MGNWASGIELSLEEEILLLRQLGFGIGEMSVEGPSLFPMGQMFTSQKNEPLTELALGGTMRRKAMDYASTKAEILSCQEVVSSHQRQPAPPAL